MRAPEHVPMLGFTPGPAGKDLCFSCVVLPLSLVVHCLLTVLSVCGFHVDVSQDAHFQNAPQRCSSYFGPLFHRRCHSSSLHVLAVLWFEVPSYCPPCCFSYILQTIKSPQACSRMVYAAFFCLIWSCL